MKNDKIDFDEVKKGMNEFMDNKMVKIAISTAFAIAGIYVSGKLMRLLAGTITDYKALRGSIEQKPFPPKTN